MRTRSSSTLMTAIAIVALGACDQSTDQLVAPPGAAAPSASVAAAESGSGAIIVRGTAREFTLVFDAERGLLSAHLPSTICVPGNPGLSALEVQRIFTPSEIDQFIARTQTTDATVAVYRATSLADAGLDADINAVGFGNIVDVGAFCGFLLGPNRIAEGSVRRTSTLSNASFHAQWTGTIAGVNGGAYRLTEVYQLNADAQDPSNPDTFEEHVVRIGLRALP